jgi:hypothetical protein
VLWPTSRATAFATARGTGKRTRCRLRQRKSAARNGASIHRFSVGPFEFCQPPSHDRPFR